MKGQAITKGIDLKEEMPRMVVGLKARGGKELKKHLLGQKLTQRQMILAKCYDCMGGLSMGKWTAVFAGVRFTLSWHTVIRLKPTRFEPGA